MVPSQFNSLSLGRFPGVYPSRVDTTGTKTHWYHGTWTPLHTTLAAKSRFIGQDAAATAEPHLVFSHGRDRCGKKQIKKHAKNPCEWCWMMLRITMKSPEITQDFEATLFLALNQQTMFLHVWCDSISMLGLVLSANSWRTKCGIPEGSHSLSSHCF